jgi:hypothetical protein
MTLFRQVSWLTVPRPSPPSRILHRKAQWPFEEWLAADSCGGSSGFDSNTESHRIPFSPVKRTGAPELTWIEGVLTAGVKLSTSFFGAVLRAGDGLELRPITSHLSLCSRTT